MTYDKIKQDNPYAPNLEMHATCFKKLHKDAVIPKYETKGAVGMDIVSLEDTVIDGVTIVRTGLAVRFPKGFYGQLCDRSSNPIKKGVHLANNIGIIDSDFRGELKVLLQPIPQRVPVEVAPNIYSNDFQIKDRLIKKGDRIAQLIIMPAYKRDIMEVAELDDTERSSGSFGSTGA